MGEVFEARPSEVAGLGKLADLICTELMACHRYISDHAGLSDGLPGEILQAIAPPMSLYQESTRARHVHLAANCGRIGDELQRSAWMYADQEKKNYDQLNAHTTLTPVPYPQPGSSTEAAVGIVEDYDAPADYGVPSGIEYPEPNHAADDIREKITEVAGWLGELDTVIYDHVGWSPLAEAVLPIVGNWNEIRRVGEAFEIAGNAIEAAAATLESGVRRVDESWDGLAAQAFLEYSGRHIAAMEWEGPAGRTVGELSSLIADQMCLAVQTVVRKIVELLDKEIEVGDLTGMLKTIGKRIPFLGTAWQVERFIEICREAHSLTMELVEQIRTVAEDFARFLEAIADPEGQMAQKVEHYLAPLNEALDDAESAVDAGMTADLTPVINTPDEGFSVGEGSAPWQNA